MGRNEKADLRGIGSYEKHSTGKLKRFLFSDYKQFGDAPQCKNCGSDYMKFSSPDGYCQRCQQLAEFILREYPATAERAKARGAY